MIRLASASACLDHRVGSLGRDINALLMLYNRVSVNANTSFTRPHSLSAAYIVCCSRLSGLVI